MHCHRLCSLTLISLCLLTGGVRADDNSDADGQVTDVSDPPFQREMALILASHLFRAHHEADLRGLQDLADPRRPWNWPALEDAFRRQLRHLLPATQVTCGAERGDHLQPVPDRLGGLRLPQSYRCEVPCVRGSYTVHALLGPSDPLAVPDPRPGPLLALSIEAPAAPSADAWPLRALAGLLLLPLWALALRLLAGVIRRHRRPRDDDPPRDAFARLRRRALRQLAGTAQLLLGAAVAGLLGPQWWRLTSAEGGVVLLSLGLLGIAALTAALVLGGLAHWDQAR